MSGFAFGLFPEVKVDLDLVGHQKRMSSLRLTDGYGFHQMQPGDQFHVFLQANEVTSQCTVWYNGEYFFTLLTRELDTVTNTLVLNYEMIREIEGANECWSPEVYIEPFKSRTFHDYVIEVPSPDSLFNRIPRSVYMADGYLQIFDKIKREDCDRFTYVKYRKSRVDLSDSCTFIVVSPSDNGLEIQRNAFGLGAGGRKGPVSNSWITYQDIGGEVCGDPLQPYLTGLEEESQIEDLGFYPNPSRGVIHLKATAQLDKVVVMDASGHKVYESSASVISHGTIDLRDLPSGVYFIKLKDNQGTEKIDRLVLID